MCGVEVIHRWLPTHFSATFLFLNKKYREWTIRRLPRLRLWKFQRKFLTGLASENIELHDIIGDKIADRLQAVSLSTPEPVTFMAVGMRFNGDHTFSENDEIKLEKEDDNAFDNKAIKVLVEGKKVGYVAREYTMQLREMPDFEQKKIKLVKNFRQSTKLELIPDK